MIKNPVQNQKNPKIYLKSNAVNKPNWLYRPSCCETKSLAILHKSSSSVSFLLVCKIDNELNLLFDIVDLSLVFMHRAVEKDLSAVHEVAGLTNINSQTLIMFGIKSFLLLGSFWRILWMSLKQVNFESFNRVFQICF